MSPQPWIAHYEKGVPPIVDIPDLRLHQMLVNSAKQYPRNLAVHLVLKYLPLGLAIQSKMTYAELDAIHPDFISSIRITDPDFAVEGILAKVRAIPTTDDAIDDLRSISVALFDGVVDRPWLAAYFLRNTSVQPSSLAIYEHLGEKTLRLVLTPRQRFHAVSAITGYVIGTATDLGQEPPAAVVEGSVTREAFLADAADQWRALDPDEFPFVHHIVDEFAIHVDADQFRAGLDLLLAGLRLQATTS